MSIYCREFRSRVGVEWHELLSVVCPGPKFLLLNASCLFACDFLRPHAQSENITEAALVFARHSEHCLFEFLILNVVLC